MNDELLSTSQAGALVGRTRQTIERWIREDGLRATVDWSGRRKVYRIRRSDLVDFVKRWEGER